MRTVTTSAALLAICAACAGDPAPSPVVTGPVYHLETALTRVGDDLGPAAAEYVAAAIELSAGDELEPVAVTTGIDGLRHARLQQMYAGVPVAGATVLVHADETTFLGYGGTITANLDGFDVEPALTADEAAAIALASSPGRLQSTELVILPRDYEGEGADLVWQVEVRGPGATALVAAETGAVLAVHSHGHPVEQGSGPGGNPRVAWTWDARLDVEADGGDYVMETDRLKTLDRASGDVVVRGPLDALPDPAANDAHGFAEITLDMMRDWIGVDSIDGNGRQIVSIVNDPDPCDCKGDPRCVGGQADNACFWYDDVVMRFGTGATMFHSLSSGLDVVAHEMNHGFSYFHARFQGGGMPSALSEHFSDIGGTAAEFYHQGDVDDLTLGEDASQSGLPLRDLCEPTCQDPAHPCLHPGLGHVKEYTQPTGGHAGAGIPNRAFCLAVGRYEGMGIATLDAVRELARAWYAAQDGRWNESTTFTQACQGVVDGARALGNSEEQIVAIAQSWADVGVLCKSGVDICVEDGVCDVFAGETCASCPGDCDSCTERKCKRFEKGKCKVGIGDCSDCGNPTCGDGVCDDDEDDGNCGQDCGCAAPGNLCGSIAPFGCYCDQSCNDADRDDCCEDKEAVCGP